MDGKVLFNNALNTFTDIWRRPMVIDHSDRGNPVPPLHRRLSPINSKRFFYKHHPTESGRAVAGTRNSSIKDRPDNPLYHEWMVYHEATSGSLSDKKSAILT